MRCSSHYSLFFPSLAVHVGPPLQHKIWLKLDAKLLFVLTCGGVKMARAGHK